MAARTVSQSCLQLAHSRPSARFFLQVASRRSAHSYPALEFLVPWRAEPLRTAAPRQNVGRAARKAFTISLPRSATVAIYNPKKDDDGNDMSVEITPRASNRLKEIMAKDQNPNLALRITVESGGCHGFQYLMSLTTLPALSSETPSSGTGESSNFGTKESLHTSPNTPAFEESKTKVEELDEDDTVFAARDGSEAKVVMDGPSLELLKGSKIDYTMELIGSQFKIVDNPLATSSCGCGTSFDIKA